MFRNVTAFIDVPDAAWWLFFLAFIAICWVLRKNDKREGYPLVASPFAGGALLGAPEPGSPLTYVLNEGGTTSTPHYYPAPPADTAPLYPFDGTPFQPVADPLHTPLGPGAWVMRKDTPMLTEGGEKLLQPLRVCHDWSLAEGETNPRGMAVFDCRWRPVGIVADVWIDRGSRIIRHLEVELHEALGGGRVLVPIFHTVIGEHTREIRVTALSAAEFAAVPMPAEPDGITAREEDKLNCYYAAGKFYRNVPDATKPHKMSRTGVR